MIYLDAEEDDRIEVAGVEEPLKKGSATTWGVHETRDLTYLCFYYQYSPRDFLSLVKAGLSKKTAFNLATQLLGSLYQSRLSDHDIAELVTSIQEAQGNYQ